MTEASMAGKSPVKSKINWIGLALAILGAVEHPAFAERFGTFIPDNVLSLIVSLSGILLMVLRTLATSKPIAFRTNRKSKHVDL